MASYNNEDLKTVIRQEVLDEHRGTTRTIEEVVNGSMAPDLKEMKEHGKAMERMKTNSELKNDGLIPDPIQE
ncbi:hypothetical protein [Paenibacillus sp. J2TS4]|uniref:hypothetical protein n=1 Tax=Paenibacillus sp. J2TS4 TaxID=2807194 RepID=UPI001B228DA9|nr:hypothetical protein [Paenibacillus sp. J2TS4]GIP34094.1 hypothetical protein J2TS4_33040 [Paenibacillus sp. J2TS4]